MNSKDERIKLKISTKVLYDEFKRQKIPVDIIDAGSSLLSYLDSRGDEHLLFSTSSDMSPASGMAIAGNKYRTSMIARTLGIPLPKDKLCHEFKEALSFFNNLRVVVT